MAQVLGSIGVLARKDVIEHLSMASSSWDTVSAMASIDDRLNEIRSVRNDIWRCRRRLQSELDDLQRKLLEEHLLERQSAFERLVSATFPFTLRL
ncbi:hypothetical protein BSZ22_28865 [Bradyrhizobium canariense]|uniref:Uncharacterized protein n=1 Tax=Bradyrhizobium canariense TaxID=255045 RepID=A0A1X3GZR0_9BRAD|nr:hypothetical protein BSZ22_28865 [Bradyrhizobium canariense]OSI76213.1 hypothetical protein BSZ23_25405 [Bradyrhizobium canariense]OSI87632.1 hypothetical protein BSZ25_26875 [Bradyrhizobium canariense]OSI87730.1 hypothetical protein BSZ24_26000 [Bradyrhizobium canariense]OSI99716.1 hypothetical protein BSZ16_26855 [Bradyrhizobium canariense]